MPAIAIPLSANIEAIIDANPAGSVFQFAAGVYRGEQFTAKSGDQFIGAPDGGTRLSGAMMLDHWVAAGRLWVDADLPAPLIGQRVAGSAPLASDRNDLFVDNVLYRRVGSLSEVAAGSWYFNPKTRGAYIEVKPSDHTIEYSVTPGLTYDNGATGVVVRGLTIERYATDAQTGPIHGVRGWRIIDVTSRQNHGAGLNIGANTRVERGHYVDNGQIGINGWRANGATVIDAEIAGNNYAGYNREWEAGGLKLAGSSDVVVSGNNVHSNNGQGLWSDIDDRGFTYTNNTVTDNNGVGIMYEISHGRTVIRNNTISCNSGPGVYISNSDGVEVSSNTITVAPGNRPGSDGAAGGGGIDIINAVRGSGPYGIYQSTDDHVHNNIIIHPGDDAQDGVFVYQDIVSPANADNVFDFDSYFVQNTRTPHWHFGRSSYRWDTLLGDTIAEPHGRMAILHERMKSDCQPVKHASSGVHGLGRTLRLGLTLLSILRPLY